MKKPLVMPQLGLTMEEGTISAWLKEIGQRVEKGEPIVTITTDKADIEVESTESGYLRSCLMEPGAEAKVGLPIAYLTDLPDEPMEDTDATPAAAGAPPADLSGPAVSPVPEFRLEPATGLRRHSARRVAESYRSAVHYALFRTVSAEALTSARPAKGPPTLNDLICHAAVRTLARHPRLNAHYVDEELRLYPSVHLGVAVATDRGLLVAVVREADRLGLAQLSERAREATEAARAGIAQPDDLKGSTFTVSNLGGLGVHGFTAILNPPEVALLAVGAVRDEPVVRNGKVVAGRTLVLSLILDHRAVDGAEGAAYLADLAREVEGFEPPA